ncbi:type II toxin-antitoxin system VapC family toxin [Planctomicrobium piriforme]|uniref:tRNA(fMet)-specific endonuclease VapC n=1 Tax=Planctomicrobium piriforme TaxID=1576369 RepID=A0A1I3D877_9PLAN|nr:type II toxin-antitoxin system VapC family toxin [Planctomicrobium piriforme]SFH82809.1 tRNA(fMet)-specific endonuclease VapC [Planctomicrobium piriforme]
MPRTPGLLLDTNIIVHLLRNGELGQSIDSAYQLRTSLASSLICVVTIGEMRSLARKLKWGQRKQDELQQTLEELVWIDISSDAVLDAYSEIDDFSEKVVKPARPLGQNDIWIAAVARATGATLLTTDKDFDHLQGKFIDRIWIDPTRRSSP